MEFKDSSQSIEQNEPASEKTKRDLLDLVIIKANEAYNRLPYPRTTTLCSDDNSRIVSLTDWTPEGRYYDPPVAAEIGFYEKNKDGFDVSTKYEFLEGLDGLNLAKYVEMNPTRSEEVKQAERAAMKLLNEAIEKKGGFDINRLRAFFDAAPEEQKKRWAEEKAREEKEWLEARAFADESGISFVSESEALALIDMIRSANWDNDSRP